MSAQKFSSRLGYVQPKAITFRDELPVNLRVPIFEILHRKIPSAYFWERIERLFNPYGIDAWPETPETITVSREESSADAVAAKRIILGCAWFRVYDVIEDIFQQLDFYETELRTDPEEEGRAYPLQQELNTYFIRAGIGWKLGDDGKIVARGDEAFETTITTTVAVLEVDEKPTAAGQLRFALSALSARPKPNTGGAVSHATNAVECVLGEITGSTMTLGEYLNKIPGLFHPALKKGLGGIYGYASDEGYASGVGRRAASFRRLLA